MVVSGGGCVVTMLSGGQGKLLAWNVTSARCTQVESKEMVSMILIITNVELVEKCMHILTRESQEDTVGISALSTSTVESTTITNSTLGIDIPHPGQLNMTNSTTRTPE